MKKPLKTLTPNRDRVCFPYKGVKRTELVIDIRIEGEVGQIATKFFGWHDPCNVMTRYVTRPR